MNFSLKESLASFEQACRDKDLRLTPQRLEIFKELARAEDHPSAEALHQRLLKKMPTLSLDTVYRTLGTFVQNGLVKRVETVENQARFEIPHLSHHHLICEKCKKIMDFQWDSIDAATLPEELESWGRINRKSVVLYGICQKCLAG